MRERVAREVRLEPRPRADRRRDGDRSALWGHRFADVFTQTKDGRLAIDYRRFHATEPVKSEAQEGQIGRTHRPERKTGSH
jgi:hypothetical protein